MLVSLTAFHPQTAHATPLPAYRYTKTFDTSASGAYAQGNNVAVNTQGDIYVTGTFQGTVVFDGPGGSDSRNSTNQNFFLTKYNSNGSYAYTKIFDTSASGAYAAGNSIVVDIQGNIYITGTFAGTIVFDGPGGSDSQTSANQSTFLTKYNSDGSYAYTKIFNVSASGAFAVGSGVAIDKLGNIYITGFFQGTVVFDGPGGSNSLTSSNSNSFLTKYNSNGSYAYTKIFDTSASGALAGGAGVAIDSQGSIYVAGYFQGTVVFDGPGGSNSLTSSNSNSFLTKYNSNGSYAYTKIFDTSASATSAGTAGIAIDRQDNIYILGSFNGTVIFDGPGGSDSQTSANQSTFLTKYNSSGNYVFTKYLDTSSGTSYTSSYGIAVDSLGDAYIIGSYWGTVTFDGSGGSDTRSVGAGYNGSYLTSFHSNGTYAFTETYDTSTVTALALGAGVASDTQGNVYATGSFQNTVTFDGSGGSDTRTSPNLNTFLTSYQAFIPNLTTNPVTPLSPSNPLPKAPNTGFGINRSSPVLTLVMTMIEAVLLAGMAIIVRKI